MKTYKSIDEVINVSNYELNDAIYRLSDEFIGFYYEFKPFGTHKNRKGKKQNAITRDRDRIYCDK